MNITAVENRLVEKLRENNQQVATAESCTGGLLAGTIVNVEGASAVFEEGYITYANEAKEKILHVSHQVLETFGAVSYETAQAMALGTARISKANLCLATTGIAGPSGGTKEKPVGLVYIGCFYEGNTMVKRLLLKGNREQIRQQAVQEALQMGLDILERY